MKRIIDFIFQYKYRKGIKIRHMDIHMLEMAFLYLIRKNLGYNDVIQKTILDLCQPAIDEALLEDDILSTLNAFNGQDLNDFVEQISYNSSDYSELWEVIVLPYLSEAKAKSLVFDILPSFDILDSLLTRGKVLTYEISQVCDLIPILSYPKYDKINICLGYNRSSTLYYDLRVGHFSYDDNLKAKNTIFVIEKSLMCSNFANYDKINLEGYKFRKSICDKKLFNIIEETEKYCYLIWCSFYGASDIRFRYNQNEKIMSWGKEPSGFSSNKISAMNYNNFLALAFYTLLPSLYTLPIRLNDIFLEKVTNITKEGFRLINTHKNKTKSLRVKRSFLPEDFSSIMNNANMESVFSSIKIQDGSNECCSGILYVDSYLEIIKSSDKMANRGIYYVLKLPENGDKRLFECLVAYFKQTVFSYLQEHNIYLNPLELLYLLQNTCIPSGVKCIKKYSNSFVKGYLNLQKNEAAEKYLVETSSDILGKKLKEIISDKLYFIYVECDMLKKKGDKYIWSLTEAKGNNIIRGAILFSLAKATDMIDDELHFVRNFRDSVINIFFLGYKSKTAKSDTNQLFRQIRENGIQVMDDLAIRNDTLRKQLVKDCSSIDEHYKKQESLR